MLIQHNQLPILRIHQVVDLEEVSLVEEVPLAEEVAEAVFKIKEEQP